MNNINFSIDGPVMNGTWYNPQTNDKFTVRDTFFENNQLIIQTTDGRMMDYNMIQNYVQCDPKDIPSSTESKQSYNIPAEVASILETPTPQDSNMIEEDMALLNNPLKFSRPDRSSLGNLNKTNNEGIGLSEDQRLVERVLSRQQQPSISCNINWPKFPQKQMDVLMDMMGVDLDDVCDFYISKIDLNDIREAIKKDIEHFINVAMGYIEPEVIDPKTSSVFPEVVVTPCDCKESVAEQEEEEQTQPKKKTTRTTKKTTKKK
jgi:hypothetical protein